MLLKYIIQRVGSRISLQYGKKFNLEIREFSTYREYREFNGPLCTGKSGVALKNICDIMSFEKNLIPKNETSFSVSGYCFVCGRLVNFAVDFLHAYNVDGCLVPNWRETLVCPTCQLNNRMRAAIHVFWVRCRPSKQASIYLTEHKTALYEYFDKTFHNVWSSEYLDNNIPFGTYTHEGIRNEDLTKLTFNNDQFDYVLSFDVIEHIPHYKKALSECWRCLKKDGIFLLSVPFLKNSEKTLVRAFISDSGEIVHQLPPEFHGDPLRSEGSLCYYHFGWDFLDDLRSAGFDSVKALIYWSEKFGYLGGEQLLIMAKK